MLCICDKTAQNPGYIGCGCYLSVVFIILSFHVG